MGYIGAEITRMCEAAMDDVAGFYRAPFVNYRGRTSFTTGAR